MIEMKNRWFITAFILIAAAGFFLRFYELDMKLLHHDENVLEQKFVTPIVEGKSPLWYLEQHGMLPNYFTAFFVKIFGLSVFSLRFAAALFGSIAILLLYLLRKRIGDAGVLVSSLFLALSPTFVYYSRQYNPYPFYLFFLLLFIIVGMNTIDRFTLKGFYSLFVLAAILFNINEIFLVFLFIALAYVYIFYGIGALKKIKQAGWKHLALAIIVFLFLFTFIHTCFFTKMENIERLGNIFSNLADKTSNKMEQPFYYYLKIIFHVEIGLAIMTLIGCIYFRKEPFSKFLVFWSLASIAIFSVMSYKVRWLLPVVIFPWILLSGSSAEYLLERHADYKKGIMILIAVLLGITLAYSIQQNFMMYNPNVNNVLGQMETAKETEGILAMVDGYGKDNLSVYISFSNSWPLPFYLREYNITMVETSYNVDVTLYPQYDVLIGYEGQFINIPEGYQSRDFGFKVGDGWIKKATVVLREKVPALDQEE